ncbi:MAG: aminotransferase class I/II-fold pyridoxal phosphate-dependent enzyme [Clostridia bacterium]
MLDYNSLYSDRNKAMKPSGIRKFFDIVATMEGAISLGVGEPDFETPWQARRSAVKSIENGYTFYTSNAGLLDLRNEISRFINDNYNVNYNPQDEILITVGGSEAIDNALRSFINEGDEVLIPEPSFVCYTPLTISAGGVPVVIQTKVCDEFRLTAKDLKEAITEKTKILILPYPSNPTGAIMEREHLEEIAEVLRDTNIIVISDEIYADLNYYSKHVCFSELEGMRERTIVISGFSKSFAMTGWRLGYALAPKELLSPILKMHQFGIMSAPTASQFAGITALTSCTDYIEEMKSEYNLRRTYLLNQFKRLGLPCFEAKGAFYLFPSIKHTGLSSEEFCEKLLYSKKLAIVPGNAFGECGEGFVRISYSYSFEHLQEAIVRLEEFLKELSE